MYDSYVMTHNGRRWEIKLRREQWFAHDDMGGCVGPYSTPNEAAEWVRAIRP